MSRYGYGVTENVIVRLIRDVVHARAPDMVQLVEHLRVEHLSEAQRETIRELLADELVEEGLGPDDEPNERGHLVEAAIDWLGHQ